MLALSKGVVPLRGFGVKGKVPIAHMNLKKQALCSLLQRAGKR